jgi:hypothetical protein
VAGRRWALHPAWEVALHHFGPGHAFPHAFATTCLSFDLLVAAYISLAYRYTIVLPWSAPVS